MSTSNMSNQVRRLALYVFWEKNGIARNYVLHYLKALKEVATEVIVVANGGIHPQSEADLKNLGVEIHNRENIGIDFGAWQEIILHTGWNYLESFDELILCNCSCYGPLWSFKQTFATMACRKCDFWGMTYHPESGINCPEHLQSFFLVFRQTAISHRAFRLWWQELQQAKSYEDEIYEHEVKFTRYLAKNGLTYDCLMNYDFYKENYPQVNATILQPLRLLQKDKLPLIKRRLFYTTTKEKPQVDRGIQALQVMNFISEHTSYPTSYIWEDLLSTCKMSDLKDVLHLNRILSPYYAESTHENNDVALICYAYYSDLAPYMCHYIESMPKHSHIYIISSQPDTLAEYRKRIRTSKFTEVEFIIKPNRGRDVSALLVAAKDLIQKHEYICFVHDKKSKHFHPIVAENQSDHCMECCLSSEHYVMNILHTFSKEPQCGLLVPPTVNFGPYNVMGYEQGMNAASMQQAYDMLKLNCPMDDAPVTSFGTCFWARSKALVSMYNYAWDYADFPDEPMPPDQTLSHGLERIFPIAAQNAGFYTAWVSPSGYAEYYMNDLAYKFREYNKLLFKRFGYQPWANLLTLLDAPHGDNSNNFIKASDIIAYLKRKYKIRKAVYFIVNVLTLGIFRKKYRKKLRHLKEKIRGIKQGENVQL